MRKYRTGITLKLTSLMFLMVALTVLVLLVLARMQMHGLEQNYFLIPRDGATAASHLHGSMTGGAVATMHDSLIWVGIFLLAVGLLTSWLLARRITRPVKLICAAAGQISRGKYEQRISHATNDEIGELAESFNKMAQSLAESEQSRRNLLANVAHELRTPLAVIYGNLEGMIDGVVPVDSETLASLREEAVRLNRLIGDLRDFSLAETGQLTLEKQPTDINELSRRSLQLLKPLADAKGIAVRSLPAEQLPEIPVDNDRLSQVIYNLITNAIRYTAPGGWIELRTCIVTKNGLNWIALTVSDSGCGISGEDLPKIFDVFYRGDKSRDRASGGSGLGLAIARQLTELHGGILTASSRLGTGSEFQLLLPIR